MDYLDYRRALGIGFNDEEKIEYLYNVLFNLLDSMSGTECSIPVSVDEYKNYCNNAGVRGTFANYYEYNGLGYIIDSLYKATKISFQVFLVRLVAFLNCSNESRYTNLRADKLKEAIHQCFIKAHIGVEFLKDSDGYFIFPQGAGELDDALVGQPLLWLLDYPLTYKRYSQVLRKYSEKSDSSSNIADDFRKVLETFFQEFFGKSKSLENLKSEYGTFLKEKGVPPEISNNLEAMLTLYTKFNNSYAKHHGGEVDNVLEYIMYQTGCIIRLLISLK